MLPVLLPLCCSQLSRISRITIQSFSKPLSRKSSSQCTKNKNISSTTRQENLSVSLTLTRSREIDQRKAQNVFSHHRISRRLNVGKSRDVPQLVAEIGWFHCKNCQTQIQMSFSLEKYQRIFLLVSICKCGGFMFVTNILSRPENSFTPTMYCIMPNAPLNNASRT